jgi:poly(3-hydroxybutyrate) depolymerase
MAHVRKRKMTPRWFRRTIVLLALVIAIFIPRSAESQASEGNTLEATRPPGNNYDKAAFKLWYPQTAAPIEAVLVLMPGSNGDARSQVDDPGWRDFATHHKLALLGCQITDKPHDQNFIEVYANASQGSGQALLDGLSDLAKKSMHPELATAPLLLWGMSAGGEFNYEFVAWKPDRVAAFVVNKGGIYYTALTSQATRNVPGLLFIGGKDLESRIDTITGLFAINRRAGALWALTEEPSAAHIVGRSRDMATMFFEDVLPLRLGEGSAGSPATLKSIVDKSGFIGDLKTKTFQPAASGPASSESTVWLPTERVARAWQAMVTEKPFDP